MSHTNHPLISVAMCTYNGAKYLRPQLDSIIQQTYPNLEINIFDDCSDDDTVQILKEYAEINPQINIHQQPVNQGYQKNFAANFKSCKGEFIAPCDQDDIWDHQKIEKLYEIMRDNILVYHDSELIDHSGKSLGVSMINQLNFVKGKNPHAFLFYNCVSGHSMLFRRSLLDHIFPFPSKGFYDHWMVYVASHFGTISYIEDKLVKYRQHQNNLTDILGDKRKLTKREITVSRIERENDWLKVCADYEAQKNEVGFASQLYECGKARTTNYFNPLFSYQIWKHRFELLHIPKHDAKKKFSFAIRQFWGVKAKTLYK